jgi:hypothetical protein
MYSIAFTPLLILIGRKVTRQNSTTVVSKRLGLKVDQLFKTAKSKNLKNFTKKSFPSLTLRFLPHLHLYLFHLKKCVYYIYTIQEYLIDLCDDRN